MLHLNIPHTILNIMKHLTLITLATLTLLSCCRETAKISKVTKLSVVAIPSDTNSEIGSYIAKYKTRIDAEMNEVIGNTDTDLYIKRHDSPLGNLVAEMMWQRANTIAHTDCSIFNAGGIRTNIPKGDITIGDVYNVLPFDNTICILTFTGKEIEMIAQDIALTSGEAMYGITFDINDGKSSDIRIAGKPIDYNKTYTIVTNDYIAQGNDGLASMSKHSKMVDTGLLMRDVAIEHIKNKL